MHSLPEQPDERDEAWREIQAALSVAYAALTDALAVYDRLVPHESAWVDHGDLRERLVGIIGSLDLVFDPLPDSFNGRGGDEAES